MRHRFGPCAWASLITLAGGGVSHRALAQTAAPAGGVPVKVEEVIVTATKRSQASNKVGLSITAVSGAVLAQAGVTSPEDLAKVVPGFHFSRSLYGSPIFTIRGVGFNATALGAAPAVSVYVDQVPLSYPSMTQGATLDVARVEAIKGPQGVLFGNNSTGGAVNFVAASPTPAFHAGGSLTYARFGYTDAAGYISGPLTDTLTARVSLQTEQGGAWQVSQTRPGNTLGNNNRFAGRLLADYKPDDRLSVRVNVNGWYDKSDTPARRAIAIDPLIPGTLIGLPVNAFVPAGLISAFPPPASGDRAADWDPRDAYLFDKRFLQGSLRAGYVFSDAIKLTSITAYSDLRPNARYDSDGTAFASLNLTQLGAIRSWFQEGRADFALGPRTNLLVGVNYEHSQILDDLIAEGNVSSYNFFLGSPHGASDTRDDTIANTYAVFSSLDYRLTDTLKLIGAARYTIDRRTAALCTYDVGGAVAALQNVFSGTDLQPGACITATNGVPGVTNKTLDEHNISWRFGAEWQATPDMLVYFTANRGFKAGGFPNVFAFDSSQFKPVVQEELTAYEGGAKLGLFDRRLQLNVAVFHYDYANKQIQGRIIVPGLGPLETEVNIPSSRVNGAEVDVAAVPVQGLTLNGGVSYVDSRIGSGIFAYTPYGAYVDVGGEHFPETPTWQVNADAQYERPVSKRLDGFIGGSVVHTGAVSGAFGDLATLAVPGYTLIDARLGVGARNKAWRLTLFARNLANTTYFYSAQQTIDVLTRFYGQPRTYGVTLQGEF